MKRKNNSRKRWLFGILSFVTMIVTVFPSSAAPARGGITGVDSASISGWAWNPEDTNDVQQVEIHVFQSGKSEPVKYLHATADQYREDLMTDIKDGWHGFSVKVDWSQLDGSDFKIKAYTVKNEEFYTLGDPVSYSKGASFSDSVKSAAKDKVSASTPKEAVKAEASAAAGTSLGIFSIYGYCNCEKCAAGSGLTYSGTVPRADHTIAADLNILPLGSKVRIGDTVYTVEDIGSAIVGNKLDIYYDSHEKAVSHGMTKQEVFLIR